MYYLVTGTNGSGKTLNTLKWVREAQLRENRPVFYDGFDINPDTEKAFGWQHFDPRRWMDLPDGSICIMDECQRYFPLRGNGSAVPDYVMALTEHRKRGFDFWMITQHPGNIDNFVRKLIGSPSWHRHLKRTFGAQLVSCLQWGYCNTNCEKPNAGKDAEVRMIPFPKEVYTWYKSAELHTAKRHIPKQVWFIAGAALLVPVLFYSAYQFLPGVHQGNAQKGDQAVQNVQNLPVAQQKPQQRQALTPVEYVQSYRPRIEGLAYTAPAYDGITQPQQAPYPAACIWQRKPEKCSCYTQQATVMDMPKDLCHIIAERGYFVAWVPAPGQQQVQPASSTDGVSAAAAGQPSTGAPGAQVAQAGHQYGASWVHGRDVFAAPQ